MKNIYSQSILNLFAPMHLIMNRGSGDYKKNAENLYSLWTNSEKINDEEFKIKSDDELIKNLSSLGYVKKISSNRIKFTEAAKAILRKKILEQGTALISPFDNKSQKTASLKRNNSNWLTRMLN